MNCMSSPCRARSWIWSQCCAPHTARPSTPFYAIDCLPALVCHGMCCTLRLDEGTGAGGYELLLPGRCHIFQLCMQLCSAHVCTSTTACT